MVYSVAGQSAYPDANGPVGLIPVTAVGLMMRMLGRLDATEPLRALTLALLSIFVVLMAREGIAAMERMRGHRIEGYRRLLGYAALSLAPPIWQSVLGFGHVEQPLEIWLVLIAVRWMDRGRPARAGIAFGLAVLSRSSAVLLAVPIALSSWKRSPGSALRLFAATAVTGAIGLLPFYLADRADVVHSLFTYRGALPIGAGSIWSVARDGSLASLVQHADIAAVVAVVVATNLWLTTRRGGFTDGRLFAGMTLASASFTLLAKTVWPYYFFEVFVLGTIWVGGTWRREHGVVSLVLPPLAITTMGLIAEVGSLSGLPLAQVRAEGVGMFLMLVLVMAWTTWRAGSTASSAPQHAPMSTEHGVRRKPAKKS
jgi:hypothetical protein